MNRIGDGEIMNNETRKISVTLPQDAWGKIEEKKGSISMSAYFREIILNKSGVKDIYFLDDDHQQNFEKVLSRWPVAARNTEYRTACYILAVPMIFEKVGSIIEEFENPVDWIWRWEWKYTLSKLEEYQDVEDDDETEITYDLTGSMVQLGKFSLNVWNSYEHFNLMQCIASLDEENYEVLKCAMEMRMGNL